MWMYLDNLWLNEGSSHALVNPFYDPIKHDRPLLHVAASLAPTIWPQFHLRWACPSNAQAGELESQWRTMNNICTEMTKEVAKMKAKDFKNSMESLSMELQKEKMLSNSYLASARRTCRESLAIRRAVQSLGCMVHFSNSGNQVMDLEGST